jgi:hypothetical protein
VGDKDYDSDEADQIRHFNSQATTILPASLSREEYNKVHGLETAKDIWDVLKTAHEGDEVTKITIDASKLDNKEMTLIIKSFRQILKQRKGKDYKPCSKRMCYKCGKPGHFIAKCPMSSDSDRDNDKKGRKKEMKKYYKKKGGDAHVCQKWDSYMSSTESSSNEDAANIVVNKGLLFPNVSHKCFMAKDDKRKKVKSRAFIKYTTSSDEGSSSEDEDNLLTLFANLNMQQKEKLNELIGAIHEKDELLDSQEEFLIKENKKHVKLKNAYAQGEEKCKNLPKELRVCQESISNLRTENTNLSTKVEKLNVCDDSIVSLRNENASLIAKIDKLNDSISVAEPPELFQLKCLSHASRVATHLNRNNPSVPQI